MDRSRLTTERRNPRSAEIDRASTQEIVEIINAEDRLVPEVVGRESPQIARAVEVIVERFRQGGRLIYVGAGTSGRLGVLDASECPPTFGTPPEIVQGVIAGGHGALVRAVEGAEDSRSGGADAMKELGLTERDTVTGIAACGLTPYVHGAVEYARSVGAATLFVTCSPQVRKTIEADVVICVEVGPEVVTGSTRMKAGTATKLVLNTLTTAAMIRLGKTWGHLMVDLRATNDKLADRSERIVSEATGLDRQQARRLIDRADGDVKTALAMHFTGEDAESAREQLQQSGGSLRKVIGD